MPCPRCGNTAWSMLCNACEQKEKRLLKAATQAAEAGKRAARAAEAQAALAQQQHALEQRRYQSELERQSAKVALAAAAALALACAVAGEKDEVEACLSAGFEVLGTLQLVSADLDASDVLVGNNLRERVSRAFSQLNEKRPDEFELSLARRRGEAEQSLEEYRRLIRRAVELYRTVWEDTENRRRYVDGYIEAALKNRESLDPSHMLQTALAPIKSTWINELPSRLSTAVVLGDGAVAEARALHQKAADASLAAISDWDRLSSVAIKERGKSNPFRPLLYLAVMFAVPAACIYGVTKWATPPPPAKSSPAKATKAKRRGGPVGPSVSHEPRE